MGVQLCQDDDVHGYYNFVYIMCVNACDSYEIYYIIILQLEEVSIRYSI